MTTDEWNSLKTGSIISNNNGKNQRVVTKWSPKSRSITLPSDRTERGYTTYASCDKKMFKSVGVSIKNCKNK